VEREHWWYRGLRDALARSLERSPLWPPDEPKVLDAGCGTGENLRFLGELLSPAYLAGFDRAPEALDLARPKAPNGDLYESDICDPTIHVEDLDLIISMDVICIPGAERALPGLRRLVAHLRPGGLFALNLPAYRWLLSRHDLAVHTTQRFTASEVGALLESLGLSPLLLSYRVCALFPAAVLVRLPTILRRQAASSTLRSDLHRMPGPWLNSTLTKILEAENRAISRGVRLPWGSSVFAIGSRI